MGRLEEIQIVAAEPIQLVAEHRGVPRAVEGVGELVDTGKGFGVGDAAERVDQGVVGQLVLVVDANGSCIGVDGRHPALDEVHVGTGEPIGNLQIEQLLTGRGLVQPQALGEPGLRVDQGDVDVVTALQPAGPAHGRTHAGVSGAEDEDLRHRGVLSGFVGLITTRRIDGSSLRHRRADRQH